LDKDVLTKYKTQTSLSTEDVEFLTKKGYVVYKNNNVAKKVPESQCTALATFDVKLHNDA